MQLCDDRAVGLYSGGNIEMRGYTAVGTKLIVTPHLQFTQLQLVLAPTLTPTSDAGPTKLIVTQHLQFPQLHLVLVTTLTPASSAVPTKLIATPHLQFPQLHLVLVTTLTPTSSAGTKLIDSYPTLAVHTAGAG